MILYVKLETVYISPNGTRGGQSLSSSGICNKFVCAVPSLFVWCVVASSVGLEPTTYCLEGSRSIQMSYEDA